ncbi:hypothetical protein [uncultured Bacteroides sp.]|uniref:hypothetical protein n=1 Tax=uncultured Bacteroides sp. TaxID=162156 RepID=UPI002AAAA75D|nr:hypothetical protein [uncultured Bacteroides sp.]
MEQVKKETIDIQKQISIIDHLIAILSSIFLRNLVDPSIIEDLYNIKRSIDEINHLQPLELTSIIAITSAFELNYFKLKEIMNNIKKNNDRKRPSSNDELHLILKKIRDNISDVKRILEIQKKEIPLIYNSESYYKDEITKLIKEKEELEHTLNSILLNKKQLSGKSLEEKEQHRKAIQQKELQLQHANKQILNYQTELEEKKRQKNAIEEWKTKIKDTFQILTSHLSPIKREHNRLTILFWIYAGFTIATIYFIIKLEFLICGKIEAAAILPEWKDYIILVMPIPLTGALLWAFISQLNRAQRQMVILAKHIHEIKYIEGLLLSTNLLSVDINDSAKRVNLAIDRLLDNHLNSNSNCGKYDENSLINESKKDLVPYDLFLKLLKDIKAFTGK